MFNPVPLIQATLATLAVVVGGICVAVGRTPIRQGDWSNAMLFLAVIGVASAIAQWPSPWTRRLAGIVNGVCAVAALPAYLTSAPAALVMVLCGITAVAGMVALGTLAAGHRATRIDRTGDPKRR